MQTSIYVLLRFSFDMKIYAETCNVNPLGYYMVCVTYCIKYYI